MTKVIHFVPCIIDACQMCLFCSLEFEPIERRPWKRAFWSLTQKMKRVCTACTDGGGNHPEITSPDSIPEWCGLEDNPAAAPVLRRVAEQGQEAAQ